MLLASTFSAALPWLVAALSWLVMLTVWWLLVMPWLRRGGVCTTAIGAAWRASSLWLGWRQSLLVQGQEHVQSAMSAGPVMIVANHTGGVDPLLVQAGLPRPVRWMMARDMMGSGLEDIWSMLQVIPVERAEDDPGSVRAAMRVLKDGEVLGVFPEGRITRPPGTVRPFLEGVGLLASRSGVMVLPCWISGTPDVDGMAASILGKSHSRVQFLEAVRYDRSWKPAAVAADLRERLAAASGWPMVEEAMPLMFGPQ
jgi:1-acyl-sn-glycerol-3-phosphate acyltransferase